MLCGIEPGAVCVPESGHSAVFDIFHFCFPHKLAPNANIGIRKPSFLNDEAYRELFAKSVLANLVPEVAPGQPKVSGSFSLYAL